MTRCQRPARLLAITGLAVAFVLLGPGGAALAASMPDRPIAGADPGASAADATAGPPIAVTLTSTSPVTPPATTDDTTITVIVSVANNTATPLRQLSIKAVRDSPIIRPSVLDTTIAKPAPPVDDNLVQPMPTMTFTTVIAAHTTATLRYQFPASTIRETGGVCLCQDGIYPIDLTIFGSAGAHGASAQLGWLQTYLVSVIKKPAPVRVSWLWPLIDHPHRIGTGSTFTDDELASELAPGGRLDRALQVIEQVGADSDLTVVMDPELIDEVAVMSDGYRVAQGAKTVLGTGTAAAASWLQRLRLATAPLHVVLTPWADPAVDLVVRTGLGWLPVPAAIERRIELALGRSLSNAGALAWPPGETVTPTALATLVGGGASTVVLNDATLQGGRTRVPAPPAVATVPVNGAPITALVTSAKLQAKVATLLDPNGSGLASLPALLAQLALDTLQDGATPSFIVLTPDRYIDTVPANAAAVITATTRSSWSTPIAAGDVGATIAPVDHGPLISPDALHYGGSITLLNRAKAVGQFDGNFGSALQTDPSTAATGPAAALLGDFPSAIQYCESAGWARDPTAANAFDQLIAGRVSQLSSRVQILRPANGTYSLASSSAPLLVTIVNTLTVPVRVRVTITTTAGLVGFHIDDPGIQSIPASSHRTIKVQAHVSRSGHFRVDAQLLMPDGGEFGQPLQLSVYSSALGTIGVVITVVASGVLVLALINRFIKRWRHHRELVRMMAAEHRIPAGVPG